MGKGFLYSASSSAGVKFSKDVFFAPAIEKRWNPGSVFVQPVLRFPRNSLALCMQALSEPAVAHAWT